MSKVCKNRLYMVYWKLILNVKYKQIKVKLKEWKKQFMFILIKRIIGYINIDKLLSE